MSSSIIFVVNGDSEGPNVGVIHQQLPSHDLYRDTLTQLTQHLASRNNPLQCVSCLIGGGSILRLGLIPFLVHRGSLVRWDSRFDHVT